MLTSKVGKWILAGLLGVLLLGWFYELNHMPKIAAHATYPGP